jgi:hypothetical protein
MMLCIMIVFLFAWFKKSTFELSCIYFCPVFKDRLCL